MLRVWAPLGDDKLLYPFLPADTSRQSYGLREARIALGSLLGEGCSLNVIDLGCGVGGSYISFREINGRVRWIGVEIPDSPEASAQPRKRLPLCTYDGVVIPFGNASADVIYSHQVFEHVRHPEALLSEAYRVLKPGGIIVGSTSHLEPYHSRSIWNYTPYGFCILLRDTGFNSILVRPGIDALSLIGRRCLGFMGLGRLVEPFFKTESPVNLLLEFGLRALRQPVERRNALKLLFAGHFCFVAHKSV